MNLYPRNEKGQLGGTMIGVISAVIAGLVLVTIGLAISENVETATGVTNSFIDTAQTLVPAIILIVLVAAIIVILGPLSRA